MLETVFGGRVVVVVKNARVAANMKRTLCSNHCYLSKSTDASEGSVSRLGKHRTVFVLQPVPASSHINPENYPAAPHRQNILGCLSYLLTCHSLSFTTQIATIA